MSILVIRAHKRFAVRQPVRLKSASGQPLTGLMIELSSEGCRISNLGAAQFSVGEEVEVDCGGEFALQGRIRWSHDGIAGVRLDHALHGPQLSRLIEHGRGEDETRRYGT